MNLSSLSLIFLGGGCGSVLRYFISSLSSGINGSLHFPLGTLICNILGCLLIGLFNGLSSRLGWSEDVRLMLTVGLCGGFTTFSTFSNEGLSLLQSSSYLLYALYVLLSLSLGLCAVLIGIFISH